MEKKTVKLWCITYILVILTIVTPVKPQSSAPSPTPTDCSDLVFDMIDCMQFFGTYSNATKPLPSCCTGFKEVLDANSSCICEGLSNAASMGLSINVTKAGTLPSLCHVDAPPISTCNLTDSPVPSPAPVTPPTTNPPTTNPPTTNPPVTNPPKANPPATPTNPPTSSPPSSSPSTPPAASDTPPTSATPSVPATSPSSNSPGADSPVAASIAPSSTSSGTSTMPVFLVSSIMVIASFLA